MSLLTIRDVQARLNVSRACAYALIQQGVLPHIRIGTGRGTIRVDADDLEQFIQQSKQATARAVDSPIRTAPPAGFTHLNSERLGDAWSENV